MTVASARYESAMLMLPMENNDIYDKLLLAVATMAATVMMPFLYIKAVFFAYTNHCRGRRIQWDKKPKKYLKISLTLSVPASKRLTECTERTTE